MNDRFKMRIERRSLPVYLSSIHIRTLADVPGINLASVAPIAHSLTIATDRMIQRRRPGWRAPQWLRLRRIVEQERPKSRDR